MYTEVEYVRLPIENALYVQDHRGEWHVTHVMFENVWLPERSQYITTNGFFVDVNNVVASIKVPLAEHLRNGGA